MKERKRICIDKISSSPGNNKVVFDDNLKCTKVLDVTKGHLLLNEIHPECKDGIVDIVGSTLIRENLIVNGSFSSTGPVNFDETVNFNETVIFNNEVIFNETTIFEGTTIFNEESNFNATVNFNEQVIFNETIIFEGTTFFNEESIFNATANFNEQVNMYETVIFEGTTFFNEESNFNATTNFNEQVNFNETVIFNGPAYFCEDDIFLSTIEPCDGNLIQINADVQVNGNQTITENLNVEGNITTNSDLSVCNGIVFLNTIQVCPGNDTITIDSTNVNFTNNVSVCNGTLSASTIDACVNSLTFDAADSIFTGNVSVCNGTLFLLEINPCPGNNSITVDVPNLNLVGDVNICNGSLFLNRIEACNGTNVNFDIQESGFSGNVNICNGALTVSTINSCPASPNINMNSPNVIFSNDISVCNGAVNTDTINSCSGTLNVVTDTVFNNNTTDFCNSNAYFNQIFTCANAPLNTAVWNGNLTILGDFGVCSGEFFADRIASCNGQIEFLNPVIFNDFVEICGSTFNVGVINPCDGSNITVNGSITANGLISCGGPLTVGIINPCDGTNVTVNGNITTNGLISCTAPITVTDINPCVDTTNINATTVNIPNTLNSGTANITNLTATNYNLTNVNNGSGIPVITAPTGPGGNTRGFRSLIGAGDTTITLLPDETIQISSDDGPSSITNQNVGNTTNGNSTSMTYYGEVAGPTTVGDTLDFRRFITDSISSGYYKTDTTTQNIVYQDPYIRATANLAGNTQTIPDSTWTRVNFQGNGGNAYAGIEGNPLVQFIPDYGIQRLPNSSITNFNYNIVSRFITSASIQWENNVNGTRIAYIGALNDNPPTPTSLPIGAGGNIEEISGLALSLLDSDLIQPGAGDGSQVVHNRASGGVAFGEENTYTLWLYQNSGGPLEIGSNQNNVVNMAIEWVFN